MKQMMKRLVMVIALATAIPLAGFSISPAQANDAHHPAGQTTKAKKVPKPAAKKTKGTKTSGMPMNCPMMSKGMKQDGMKAGGMKCRMGSAKMHRMHSKMHGARQ